MKSRPRAKAPSKTLTAVRDPAGYADLVELLNLTGVMFFVLDEQRKIVTSNWVAQLRLGYLDTMLQGLPFTSLYARELREEIHQALLNPVPGQPVILHHAMQALDGTAVPLELRAFTIEWQGREEFFCICSDRSEQAALQEELRQARDQVEHYTQSSAEFFYCAVTDLSGALVMRSLSENVERLTSYPASAFLAGEIDLYALVHPEDQQTYQESMQQRLIHGSTRDVDYRIIRQDGGIVWLRDHLRHRRISDSRIVLEGVATNITSQKQAELTLYQANEQLRLWLGELRQRNSEMVFMNEMSDSLQSSITVQNAYDVVAQYAGQIFNDYCGALYMLNPANQALEIAASWGKNPPTETGFAPDDCWALRRGQVQAVTNPQHPTRCRHVSVAGEGMSYLCVPVAAQAENLGMLHIRSTQGKPLDHLKQVAQLVAGRVALAVSNLRLSESLRVQSIRDQLTGLFNRRYMEEMMQREVHRAVRYNRPLGIMMMDIDHFKKYNDTHGHPAADAILKSLGGLIQSHTRREDIACRYGGEEFIIIMAEASLQDTRNRAEALRHEIREMVVNHGALALEGITVSIGVAGFPDHGRTPMELIQAADNALYRAKREGRDRVVMAV